MSTDPSLTAKKLQVIRQQRLLFTDLNFELHGGQILLVTGANGSGKTTLLRTLVGLYVPTRGRIYWQGQDITKISSAYCQQLHYIGHKLGIKDRLTAVENLQLSLCLKAGDADIPMARILQKIELTCHPRTLCGDLSVGQQKRVALASLLLVSARLWILDEPFAALDEKGIQIITQLLKEHIDKGGMIVLSSHQPIHLLESTIIHLTL